LGSRPRVAGAAINHKLYRLEVGAWCIRRLIPLDHRPLLRSNGRFTIFGPLGVPLLLMTTGKKSGQLRQVPLTYMREADRLFRVGSNFGRAHHPAWASNLLAEPNAWVTMGGREIPVVAIQLTGRTRDRIFRKFADYASNYDAYRHRADRELRVFDLTKR
ncbi:MAG TPA: nitroreductase/quinone reductase family protein, partial [Mycobacterium sp.]|nr:nitroreductase/quinone reductase family protein [Mycobacterium sp.]